MSSRGRKLISGAIRLGILAFAVVWMALDPNWKWSDLREVVRTADWRLLAFAILSFGPCPVLIALRLKWLLSVHQVNLSIWQAIKVTFAGNFIIWALPVGTSGGDAAKAFYIARDTPHKHEAVTTVFFDRVVGVVSLVLMSGLMALLNWGNPAMAEKGRVIGVFALVFFCGAAVYFSNRLRRVLGIDWILARLPLAAHLQRIDRAVFEFRRQPRVVLAALLLTIALQSVCILSLYLSGWSLGVVGERPLEALPLYFAYGPVCFLAGALPIGGMEAVCVLLFSRTAELGPPGAAVLLALSNRAIQLLWALPGALVVLRGGSLRRTRELIEHSATADPPESVATGPLHA